MSRRSRLFASGAFLVTGHARAASPFASTQRFGLAALVFIFAGTSIAVVSAQETGKQKSPAVMPLPPARPANLGGAVAPVPTPPVAPAPDAAAPSPPPPPEGPHPLPAASRERMHACGAEWQKMKMEGTARDKTWRDFAEICLTK